MKGYVLLAVGLLLVAIICFPLFWMIASSLKSDSEIITAPPTLFPSHLSISSYQELFQHTKFESWFVNSTIVAVGTMLLVVLLSTLAAYSLIRFRYPGRQVFSVSVLVTYFFPPVLMIVPIFLILLRLHLLNSYIGLIIAHSTFALPFGMWFLRPFFASIPIQVEESALVDGASRLRAFADVVIPQVIPGIIATSIFTFIHSWNDYLFSSILISSPTRVTLPVGIAAYSNELNIQWGRLMAASVLVTIPVLVFFILLQRRLIRGVGAGAVKG